MSTRCSRASPALQTFAVMVFAIAEPMGTYSSFGAKKTTNKDGIHAGELFALRVCLDMLWELGLQHQYGIACQVLQRLFHVSFRRSFERILKGF